MEGKSTFEEFKLGPLQQQLLVYEVFQFPPTKDTIPPITTFEVFRLLWKCLDVHRLTNSKSGKETNKLTLQQFMEFFIEQHNFVDPFESGVKISSIALAIQVCRFLLQYLIVIKACARHFCDLSIKYLFC